MSYKRKYRSKTTSKEYEPSWHLDTYESTFSMPQGIKSRCVSPFLRRNHNLTKPNFHLRRWRKAVIKLETRDEYKKIPWFLEHLRWCPKMGPTTNFVKSQCRPSAACYSLDIQNYPAEEQGNYWDKTKKDITILNDVTSLFVLFVLVSSRAILYHVSDQLRRADSNWTSFKTLSVKIYPGDHYIIIIVTREPKPVLKLKFLRLYWM